MNDRELKEHLEFIDGIQKAQMLALRALLRANSDVKSKIKTYAVQLEDNPISEDLSAITLEAMAQHLLALTN